MNDCDVFIESIEKIAAKSNAAIQAKNYKQAMHYLDQGLEAMGNSYDFEGLSDSTDMKLFIAEDFQKEGKLEDAANLKQKILDIRIKLYKQKFDCL